MWRIFTSQNAQLPTRTSWDAITVIRNAGELSSKGIELK
jgi:hypothetical protein